MQFYIFIILALIFIALLTLILANVRVVPQSKAYVIERLGTYFSTWDTGLHVKIPFIDRIAKIVSLKEQVVDFKPQPVITKDNVTMQIDTVVFYQITDPKLYTYGVESRFPQSKICLQQRFVTLSVSLSWIPHSPPVTPSTQK